MLLKTILNPMWHIYEGNIPLFWIIANSETSEISNVKDFNWINDFHAFHYFGYIVCWYMNV